MKHLAAALLCSVATSAFAMSEPAPSPKDIYIRTVAYDPGNRIPLTLQKGMVTNITFDVMERIQRVVLPDDAGPVQGLKTDRGDQSPLINNLPLFGDHPGQTNMIVITVSPEGKERPYLFALDVVEAPKKGDEKAPIPTFGLSFTYPIQERAAQQARTQLTWKERQEAKAKEVAEARLNTDVFYGQQNWKYLAQGRTREIVPIEAHDNGRITAFRYPGNMAHPAVFIVPGGISDVCTTFRATANEAPEQAISSTIMDDMIVVQRTAAHFRIRSGDFVAEVYNCGWDPIGVNPGTGTTSPDVVRRVVSQ